jgi:CRP-like cAMP-binding protein
MAEEKEQYNIPFEEVIPILSKLSIFGGLEEDKQRYLTSLLKSVNYSKAAYVYRQGDDASHIYIVRSGKVMIVAESPAGKILLASFQTGDCFGETSVLGIQPHSASALTAVDTQLMILSRQALLNIFETDPPMFGILILNIARETCRRLHHVDAVLRENLGPGSSQSYHGLEG